VSNKESEDDICLTTASLFYEEDSSDGGEENNAPGESSSHYHDDAAPTQKVNICNRTYTLILPPDVGTLFAHRVWSGSKLLSTYLAENSDTLVRNKRTVELGAGTGLPSLVALSNGSAFSLITDYPDESVLSSIRETVGLNWDICRTSSRVNVVGHEWGGDVTFLLAGAAERSELCVLSNENDGNDEGLPASPLLLDDKQQQQQYGVMDRDPFYFDTCILSECLWMHSTHEALAKSIDRLLHPQRGVAIVTYAHHIPGKEKEDDSFFEICKSEKFGGFVTDHVCTQQMSYMWDSSKTIDVYLKVMRRSDYAT